MQEQILCNIALGDSVVAADPCYDEGVWCAEFGVEMKPGNYEVRVVRGEVKGTYTAETGEERTYNWGPRNARLSVILIDETVERWEALNSLGVDSGRMSIWDAQNYEDANEGARAWELARYQESPSDYWFNNDNNGCWVDSGLGDGSYFCYRGRNAKGEPVALSIVFLYNDSVKGTDGRLHIDDEEVLPFVDGPASLWETNPQ